MRPIDADGLVRFLSMMDAYSSLGMTRIKSIYYRSYQSTTYRL